VTPKTCTSYRIRANYSIRWTGGGLGKLSVLSPLTRVCGPTAPPVYASCDGMHTVFPRNVGRVGAVDHTTGLRVTTLYISNWIYDVSCSPDDGQSRDDRLHNHRHVRSRRPARGYGFLGHADFRTSPKGASSLNADDRRSCGATSVASS
jgi:hypothetical protein